MTRRQKGGTCPGCGVFFPPGSDDNGLQFHDCGTAARPDDNDSVDPAVFVGRACARALAIVDDPTRPIGLLEGLAAMVNAVANYLEKAPRDDATDIEEIRRFMGGTDEPPTTDVDGAGDPPVADVVSSEPGETPPGSGSVQPHPEPGRRLPASLVDDP